MLAAILAWLGPILSGPLISSALSAYKAKLDAGNSAASIAADLAAKEAAINVQQAALQNQIIIAEQGRAWTAFPRFLIEFSIAIYIFAIVLDKIFKLHSTDLPGDTLSTVMQIALVGMFGTYSVVGAVKAYASRKG